MHRLKQCLIFTLSFCCFLTTAFAEDLELRYPELEVSPRASQRLLIEAKKEKNNHPTFNRHAPALTSAVMTLLSAYYLSANIEGYGYDAVKESDGSKVASTSMLVGAAWIGVLTYMAYDYKPYQSGMREVAKLPSKSKSDQITRERFAEEKINNAADFSQKVAFLSTATNLLASTAMAAYGKGDTALVAGLSALAAFAPYYFSNYWQTLADRHQEYKKKIYGPVSMPLLHIDQKGELISGLQWSLRF